MLLGVNGMPAIGEAVAAGRLSFQDILAIRETDNCRRFRRWLDGGVPATDQKTAVREYCAAVEHRDARPFSTKLLRFVMFTLAGTALGGLIGSELGALAGLASSTGVSAVDSLFLDALNKGWSPRAFLDDELGAHLRDR
jgi:hypothetical protein